MKTGDLPHRVTVYLVAVDPGPRVSDVLGPYDASEFGGIERGKDALFDDGPAGREVHRITGAANALDARDTALAASALGPGEPRERR